MSTTYTNYTNVDSHFSRGYKPGDRLVRGYVGEIPYDVSPDLMLETCEVLYMRHNRDDRPDGKICPSMSIGDVIIIGETAASVQGFGWKLVTVDADDLITDRPWREVVRS